MNNSGSIAFSAVVFAMMSISPVWADPAPATSRTTLAPASAVQAFTPAAFAAAQQAGKAILVDVHADWCSTCRAQAPTVEALARAADPRGMVVFRLDFDGQRAERAALGVNRQSTLIMFRGARETGRSTGVKDPAQIAALVATARSAATQ